jgi:3-oxoacyl-[acyl-carrier protein] reductase
MPMLEGKRIVITGASRGIGRAIAIACARNGAEVGINFLRSKDQAESLAAEIGSSAMLLPFDASDSVVAAKGLESFGAIDALVNNAAVNLPSLLATATDDDIACMLRTNVLGPIVCTRAALPGMISRRQGVILNVSSVAAERPSRGQSVYAATKGAIESFTRAVAVEYGRKGIRCHCIRPGPVDTEMLAATKALAPEEILGRIPLRRLITAEEVAALAVFLLSDQAAAITGTVHPIDGGFVAG